MAEIITLGSGSGTAEPPARSVTLLTVADSLAEDCALVDAIDFAVAGLCDEADCDHLAGALRVPFSMLRKRLDERREQVGSIRTGDRSG